MRRLAIKPNLHIFAIVTGISARAMYYRHTYVHTVFTYTLPPEGAFTTMRGILRKFRTYIERPKIDRIFGNGPRWVLCNSSTNK